VLAGSKQLDNVEMQLGKATARIESYRLALNESKARLQELERARTDA
jgi:hypothetical protein